MMRTLLPSMILGALLGLVIVGVWALAMSAQQTAAQATLGRGYTIERAMAEDAICYRVNEPSVGRSDWTCHPRERVQPRQTKIKKVV